MRPIGSGEDLKQRRRRALALLKSGPMPMEVASRVGVDRRSVWRWNAGTEKVRWIGVARGALLGMAVLLTASNAALADTTTLICHLTPFVIVEDEPTTIELNEAQSSVVVHFGANHQTIPQSMAGPISTGPLPAVFSTDTITFFKPDYPYRGDFVLNRLTGAFVNTSTNWRYICQACKRQF